MKPLLYIAAGALVLILLMNIFISKPKPPSTEKVEALYERLITVEKEKVELLRSELDREKKTDSLLLISLQNNKPKYESNENKGRAIPVVVANYNDDELVRAAESFR